MGGLLSTERERALADVQRDGLNLIDVRHVPVRYKADREIVLAAVKQNGSALKYLEEECKADRDIVLAAVQQKGCVLEDVAEECKADGAVVLAAVQQDGYALKYAAEECKRDREIVLAAVQNKGCALYHAAEACKADREIVLVAVQQNPDAIRHAVDELLLDSTFASEEKQSWYILKVSLLSGRSTVVMSSLFGRDSAAVVVSDCCRRLGMDRSGNETLIHGTAV
eukprot:2839631-Amphidinium_carterae.1